MPLYGQSSGSPPRFMQTGLWPRFRLPSVDRRHPSSVGMGGAFFRAFVPAAKALSGAYEEEIAGMLTIIKASLLGSALMLLETADALR
jgi:hypothetical protein